MEVEGEANGKKVNRNTELEKLKDEQRYILEVY